MDVDVFGLQKKRTKMTSIVDVVIPSYNSARFLVDAIESVLRQESLINSVLIVDDGSTDSTQQIVKKYTKKFTQINYLFQTNRGLSAARNLGITNSSAKYVAFLDADDIWLKNKLKKQLKIFEKSKNPKLGLVYCEYNDIDEEGKLFPNFPSFRLDHRVKGNVFEYLLEKNYATGSGSGVLVKRECFEKVGYFDEKLSACEDWDMWLRIAKEYDFDYVDEKLVSIRRHPSSLQRNHKSMMLNTRKFLDKNMAKNFPLSQAAILDLRRNSIKYFLKNPLDIGWWRSMFKMFFGDNSNYLRGSLRDFFEAWVYATYSVIHNSYHNIIKKDK